MKTLCRCAQACRLWNVLALDGSNWQRVDLFTFQKDVKAATVENLARRCGGFLKKLSLKGCENIQDSALRSFTAKCANIEHLSLYKCKRVTDATCENLGRHCHKLVHLNLENCTAITDRALRHIRDVELSGCSLLTDAGFIQLARHCKGLARMDLEDCSLITDATIHSLSTNCNGLSELSLSHCELITDESIHCLCTNNKDKLQVLELDNCPQITDSALSHMRHAKALKRIDLYDCQNISKEAIQRFKVFVDVVRFYD
uniref:F-box domain-containing protein n=1 Tax=Angiostrongylus cantonensis TaxID=6313 RepID=A0A0K0CV49_ANGCA